MSSFSISVVIPVYNATPYLAEAITSVLGQTCPPDEIIVVDDGSTDGSADIAHSFGTAVRCMAQDNHGQAAARNLGVTHSTGDVLAFLDADDLWLPDKLERQLTALAANPQLEAVLGGAENFISPELDEVQRNLLARSAAQTGNYHAGTLLIRRAAFLRVGQFDARWRQSDFVEWWARATRLRLVYTVVPHLLLRRRLHVNNLTRRERQHRPEYLRMLSEQLALRRGETVSTQPPEDESAL